MPSKISIRWCGFHFRRMYNIPLPREQFWARAVAQCNMFALRLLIRAARGKQSVERTANYFSVSARAVHKGIAGCMQVAKPTADVSLCRPQTLLYTRAVCVCVFAETQYRYRCAWEARLRQPHDTLTQTEKCSSRRNATLSV
jgi:hypothetical protein